MNIDVANYLSEEEIKEIAKQAFKERCIKEFEDDPATVLMNTAYTAVHKLISDTFDDNLEEHLKQMTLDVINNLSSYVVFGKSQSWEKDSRGYTALVEAVEANKRNLDSRIAELINQIDINCLNDAITALIDRKLFARDRQ